MFRSRWVQAGLLMMAMFLISACATPVEAPATVETGPSPTANVVVVTATPEATATEKPKNPVQATMDALTARITLVPPTRGPEPDDYVGMIEQAWNLINEKYFSDEFNGVDWEAALEEYRLLAADVETQEEFWVLMDEFVGELGDDHSNFRTPAEVSARYGGATTGGRPWTGIDMWPPPGHLEGDLTVWCASGPAESAGIGKGDHILAVNGEPVDVDDETDLDDVILTVMFGEEGMDHVDLTVQQGPDEDPREVRIPLGGAPGCDGWSAEILSNSPRIGYVRVADFDSGSDTFLLDTIESLEEDQPLDGLILDIRHNPGGNSDADIALFTEGTFGTVGPKREGKMRTLFKIRGPVKWNDTTPIVLLTDESSHSAADYFAVAMKLSGRATLVGAATAGNTDGWTSFSLPDGSLIGIAVMILELPDGTSIEGLGIQPDVIVPSDDWGMKDVPDIQLQTGIEVLLDQIQ
ncbi:MAG: S41 family peptidase [Anaerolineales bacterium]|nr:S41 family peptidase [Anaerolineales bacterium]